jgi:hypothetical protein
MARGDRAQPEAPKRGLSVAEALQELARIDRSLDAFYATAPFAVDAMGGRDAIQALCQPTCIGPVPRLSDDAWSAMAHEYVERQRGQRIGDTKNTWRGVAVAGGRSGLEESLQPPSRTGGSTWLGSF